MCLLRDRGVTYESACCAMGKMIFADRMISETDEPFTNGFDDIINGIVKVGLPSNNLKPWVNRPCLLIKIF